MPITLHRDERGRLTLNGRKLQTECEWITEPGERLLQALYKLGLDLDRPVEIV